MKTREQHYTTVDPIHMSYNPSRIPQLDHLNVLNLLRKQGLRRQHQLRTKGGYDQTGVPAVWSDQVNQHVLGSRDAEAQGLCVCRIRDTGGGAARPRADERRDDRWPEYQGSRT